MAKKLVWPVRVSEELGGRVDAAAALAGLPRSVWMVRALESALSGSAPKGAPGEDARVSPDRLKSDDSSSASSRASGSVRVDTPVMSGDADFERGREMARQAVRRKLEHQRKLNEAKEKRA